MLRIEGRRVSSLVLGPWSLVRPSSLVVLCPWSSFVLGAWSPRRHANDQGRRTKDAKDQGRTKDQDQRTKDHEHSRYGRIGWMIPRNGTTWPAVTSASKDIVWYPAERTSR